MLELSRESETAGLTLRASQYYDAHRLTSNAQLPYLGVKTTEQLQLPILYPELNSDEKDSLLEQAIQQSSRIFQAWLAGSYRSTQDVRLLSRFVLSTR